MPMLICFRHNANNTETTSLLNNSGEYFVSIFVTTRHLSWYIYPVLFNSWQPIGERCFGPMVNKAVGKIEHANIRSAQYYILKVCYINMNVEVVQCNLIYSVFNNLYIWLSIYWVCHQKHPRSFIYLYITIYHPWI